MPPSASPADPPAQRLDDASLPGYLERLGLLPPGADALVSRPGEGNLNYVRRVAHAGRSWIVKQARPHVEGHPEHALSTDRILFERRWDEAVRALLSPRHVILPRVEAFDAPARVLVLEDLGAVPSLEDALRAGEMPRDDLREVGRFLARVHAASAPRASGLAARFANTGMRGLHGGAIFGAPWAGLPAGIAAPLRAVMDDAGRDPALRAHLDDLRRAYFTRADALVHGDVKPANVLLGRDGPRLIDAEFAHVGDPAFDLGAALAHVQLCIDPRSGVDTVALAQETLLDAYLGVAGPAPSLRARALGYAGADVVAHVVGPSRLPFVAGPERALPALHRGLALLRAGVRDGAT